MMSGILSPAFLQAAGRAGKGAPIGKIILDTQFADPVINSIVCVGDIKVSSIKNGEPLMETYTDFDGGLSVQADANTQIIISGAEIKYCDISNSTDFVKISVKNTAIIKLYCSNCYALTTLDLSKNAIEVLECADCYALTMLDLSKSTALERLTCSNCYALTTLDLSKNEALTELYCNSCYALTTLDLSKNTALTELHCDSCHALTTLDLSKNTALTELHCADCYALTTLDLSKNIALTVLACDSCYALTTLDLSKSTALTELYCGNCKKLVSISYPATNEDVSTAIAGAITNAKIASGTVYTDSAAAYYSTIADAATAKGWTIEQIPA